MKKIYIYQGKLLRKTKGEFICEGCFFRFYDILRTNSYSCINLKESCGNKIFVEVKIKKLK